MKEIVESSLSVLRELCGSRVEDDISELLETTQIGKGSQLRGYMDVLRR